ncbi:hypothetical protein P692DRAFT_201841332 [Suillus brevipes Sb2]|nr:hypothetical protein P692DRAFT_201841332 [Suillus brevipes Sb2]
MDREHNAEFELDKTALVCLSRKRVEDEDNPGKTKPAHRPSITIGNHVIRPSHSHKFLGVIIDDELRFKKRMIRMTKGIKVIPKMLYAADIWCTDLISKGRGKSRGRGARGVVSQMARVHRMAAILTTGAMCSTATDLLDAHANILPFQRILRSNCHRATPLRLASLHNDHPLYKGIESAHRYVAKRNYTKQKRLPSPIHKLFREFEINPTVTEKILPIRHYPKWSPDIETRIAETKAKAVYLDGSAIEGGVGGAAVLMEGERRVRESRFYLGKVEEHTVYEG